MNDISDFPDPLWLASTEHPDWGVVRRVSPRASVQGPMADRQYVWLIVHPDEDYAEYPPPGSSVGVVVTPRHYYRFPLLDDVTPLHVHLWVAYSSGDLEEERFNPARPSPDVWSALWKCYAEPRQHSAKPW